MNADQILDVVRPLVLVVDGLGVIQDRRGGFGGWFGHQLDDVIGTSVFDFVAPAEVDELATYFAESVDMSLDTVTLSLPFRVTVVGDDGLEHPVEVIPTGLEQRSGIWEWVVVLVPLALTTCITRSLDAEMAGETRARVRELLTEEMAVDNANYTSRWFLIDLADTTRPTVTTSRSEDQHLARLLAGEVTDGWQPWADLAAGSTGAIALDDLPSSVREVLDARHWRRAATTPVHVGGAPAAAYVVLGRVPADLDPTIITANVAAPGRPPGRRDHAAHRPVARPRDRLVTAATRDPLTGLANREAFSDALAAAEGPSALLYIDIDHFKSGQRPLWPRDRRPGPDRGVSPNSRSLSTHRCRRSPRGRRVRGPAERRPARPSPGDR